MTLEQAQDELSHYEQLLQLMMTELTDGQGKPVKQSDWRIKETRQYIKDLTNFIKEIQNEQ